jgi:hypothetical protein
VLEREEERGKIMADDALDDAVEALSRVQLRRVRLVDPQLVEDAAAAATTSAARLLSFERWLDGLEQWKREEGELPNPGDQLAVEAFERAIENARGLAAALIDSVRPFQRTGFFDDAVPLMAEAIGDREIDFGEVFSRARDIGKELVESRGLPADLFDFGFAVVDQHREGLRGRFLSSEGAAALASQWGERRAILLARPVGVLPTVDGDTWVQGGLFRTLREDPSAQQEGVPLTSPWAAAIGTAKWCVDNYEERRRRAAERGVEVLPTGVEPLTITVIVLVIIGLIGLVISILCAAGVIRDATVCVLGIFMMAFGLFQACVESGGTVEEEPGSATCSLTSGDGDFEG